MIGIDVSLSADLQGKNIFVTGIEDKVKLIEGLITAIDQPKKSLTSSDGEAVLQTHSVEGGNVQIVYDVLQTLAGRRNSTIVDGSGGRQHVVALATRGEYRRKLSRQSLSCRPLKRNLPSSR